MGRRYRRRTYQRRERKPLIWQPCTVDAPLNPDENGAPQNVVAEVPYKLCDLSTAPNAETEVVLERIRGGLFFVGAAGQSAVLNAVVYGIVLPDIVAGNIPVGNPLPNFPNPADDQGTDDFPLVLDACMPVPGSSSGTSTVQTPVAVDVKSKRKMGKEELLTLAIYIMKIYDIGAGNPAWKGTVSGFLRYLQKIL